MPKPVLTPEILTAALQGLETQQARLDAVMARVKGMLGAHAQPRKPAAQVAAPKPKRKMSAAGRKRIGDAARKRWAEFHRMRVEAATKPKGAAAKGKAASKKAARKATA
jgi:hypothetical protein